MDTEAIRAYKEALWEQKRQEYLQSEQAKALSPEPDLPAAGPIDLTRSSRKSHRASVKPEHLPLFPDDDETALTQ